MNIHTGKIVTKENLEEQLAQAESLSLRKQLEDTHVQIWRELTVKEKHEMRIRLYSPCGCGSGKKFKFCCHKP